MSKEVTDQLSSLMGVEKWYEKGSYLFHYDDPVTHLIEVREGSVQLVRHQKDGDTLVLQRAGAGSILAEASLFSDRYHCDAIAVEQARTREVSRAEAHQLLREVPDFAEAWTRHLTKEVQKTRLRAEILSLKTVASKLDAWISLNEGVIPEKGEWKGIADEIGVSPEALYRELAKRREP